MSGIIIAGIISGCLYALVALGLVLIFRTTGAVNFAQGDVGGFGTFVAIGLSNGLWAHFSTPAGVVVGLAAAGTLNVVVYLFVIRFLEGRSADLVTTLVATLGVSEIIEGVLPNFFGYNPFSLKLFPNLPSLHLLGVSIPFAGVAIVASTAVALLVFAWVLYRTRIGMALKMGASNMALAEMSGVPMFTVKLALWFISGVIAGWGVMLFSAYDNVSTNTMAEFLLFSAVAASWGAFRSIPWTIIGAIVVGIVSDVVARYSPAPLGQSTAFVLLLVVFLVMQKREAPVVTRMDLERVFQRFVRPTYSRVRSAGIGEWVVLSTLGIVFLLTGGSTIQNYVVDGSAFAIVVAGLALSIRFGGRLNLAGGAYVLVGSYVMGIGLQRGWGFIPALLLSLSIGAVAGLLIGIVTLRLETIYFVNLGLVLSAAVGEIVLLIPNLTGGGEGMQVTAPFGKSTFLGQPVIDVVIAIAALVALGAYSLYGRSLSAARTATCGADTRLARTSGMHSSLRLVLIEGVAAATMAAGGSLLAIAGGYISVSQFGVLYSNSLIASVLLGGAWGIAGVAVGAFFGAVLPLLLGSFSTWVGVINGGVLVLVIVLFPSGAEGGLTGLYRRIPARLASVGLFQSRMRPPALASAAAPDSTETEEKMSSEALQGL